MADIQISGLTAVTSLASGDVFALDQAIGNLSKKITLANLSSSLLAAGSDTQIQFNNAGVFGASAGATYSNGLILTAQDPTHKPLIISLANSQTANAFEINSFGGSGGDLSRFSSTGNLFIVGDAISGSKSIEITSPSLNGGTRYGVSVTSNDNPNGTYYGYYADVSGSSVYSFYAAQGKAFINGTLDLNYNSLLNVGNTQFVGVPSTQYGNLLVSSESDYTAGSGGEIVLGGNHVGQAGYRTAYGMIKGVKENGTYNNSLGGLAFYTNAQSSAYLPLLSTLTESMTLSYGGGLTNNVSVSTTIGHQINLANAQTANAFEINSFGGSGGDLVEITKDGKGSFADRINLANVAGSTNNGDIWSDSTQQSLQTFTAGLEQSIRTTVYTQTADKVVANTVTETSVIGTGIGTVTMPANFLVAGKMLKFHIHGYHSSTGNPNLTLRIKLGGTTVASVTVVSGNGTNDGFEIIGEITCRTDGATGTVTAGGTYEELQNSGASEGLVKTTATTIDTTGTLAFDVTAEWGTAAAGNTITSQNFNLDIKN